MQRQPRSESISHRRRPSRPVAPDVAMTAEEASEFLRIDASTIRKLAADGKIPARKVGRQWRFSRKAMIRWISGAESGAMLGV
jgi:excisionase family DNA binding protein